jgi:hypothetical protein
MGPLNLELVLTYKVYVSEIVFYPNKVYIHIFTKTFMLLKEKKGQLTLFIIIAILIVAGVVTFVVLKNKIISKDISTEFQPIENAYLTCIQQEAQIGINTLEERGGYIELPDFEPGSSYMPSSNTLDYFGTGIPYWYYVSGNNIIKTQYPTKQNMQDSLSSFLDKNFYCDFSQFAQQGFEISQGDIKSKSTIQSNSVDIELTSELIISKENRTVKITTHKTSVQTNLGSLYDQASKVYNKEKAEAFLENYTIDILYDYAPVTGAELSCSPKVWAVNNVSDTLKDAIGNNFIFIKGNNVNFENKELNNYFTVDFNNKDNIRFLYSNQWPTKIEVSPSKDGLLVSKPIGNQAGMGILGFCFIDYHFVYDMSFPVLVQVYNNNEIFQFPLVVVIKGNKPREALNGSESFVSEPELCNYKTKNILVSTYNSYSEPVKADISFKCFNQICDLGKTEINGYDSVLETTAPACVNGFLIASSENYADAKYQISTNRENEAYIMMKKEYSVNLDIQSNGKNINDEAMIYFDSGDDSKSLYYPVGKEIKLSEGEYNITVYVYKNTTVSIPESTSENCFDAPNGILGLFGVTKKQCVSVVIPAQQLGNSVVGGGKLNQYITESELQQGNFVMDVGNLNTPKSILELQEVYDNVDSNQISLQVK